MHPCRARGRPGRGVRPPLGTGARRWLIGNQGTPAGSRRCVRRGSSPNAAATGRCAAAVNVRGPGSVRAVARELVLGVDAGHTVTKAVLFDATGQAVARGSGTLALNTPRPHWVERDMDDVWRTAHQAIAACLAEVGPGAGRSVAAIGLAGHGDGLYAVDELGRPVRAAIVAMDTRAEAVLEE